MLAAAQFTNSVGDGAYYVTSALYFTHVVELDPARTGLGLTLAWAVGSLVGVPLGRIADQRGPRGTAVLLALTTGATVASFLVVRGFLQPCRPAARPGAPPPSWSARSSGSAGTSPAWSRRSAPE